MVLTNHYLGFTSITEDMKELLGGITTYLESMGIVGASGLEEVWIAKDPKILLQGEVIENFLVADHFTYLIVEFTLDLELANKHYLERLQESARRQHY